ncbi:MAG: tRNA uridine(34) 5-carboxymethylaminomethyl modification radical SAM/GNAT enzyme Elp3 [Anaerolineae bacterium]|jgi:elongator complex protein 3|nr:tRNA uridine(34) 5-carboxymethylaminomethyl modification radical SAM/GNAT enzyme Elp3 [Anaerolineae bacterium]
MAMGDKYDLDYDVNREPLLTILRAVVAAPAALSQPALNKLLNASPRRDKAQVFSRAHLIEAYRRFAGQDGLPPYDEAVLLRLRRKPMRTLSGVTPVTVLTKPFPCPGECIFCPNDVRMPKSYLSDEPGAQRAEQNSFDPYLQTYSRLLTYYNLAHPTDKIEVIILGGTWSFYPETYQIWFVKRIFDALHDFGAGVDGREAVWAALREQSQLHPEHNTTSASIQGLTFERTYNQVVQTIYDHEMYRSREQVKLIASGSAPRSVIDEYATWDELEAAHRHNESAACRVVGLVVETRPDHIDATEVLRIRRLGCTKVQIGFQSLNDAVLKLNKRGHTVAATRRAVQLLRRAGFKIHAHWMPNLYGSSPEQDIEDYTRLFTDPDFCPDELKVYPCSLIESAELMQHYQAGTWRPYTREELLHVLTAAFKLTPPYCRLTRVIRDIPSTDIVVGNKLTNFRQLVDEALAQQGARSREIRSREIGQAAVQPEALRLEEVWYPSGVGEEVFLQYVTADDRIAGFLRLALPQPGTPALHADLDNAAIIREVHVYGQSLGLGEVAGGKAQHLGLGRQLIDQAAGLARQRGYAALAVISAIGTREYYRKRGFQDKVLYQVQPL